MTASVRRWAALGVLWLVLFTVTASYSFVWLLTYFEPARAAKLLQAFPNAWFFIWWPYLQWASQPVTLSRLLISAFLPIFIPVAVGLGIKALRQRVHGWPLRLSRPTESPAPKTIEAGTDNFGHAHFSTMEQNRERWPTPE